MDESELYIKMCDKATEIQELRPKHPIGITTINDKGKEVIQIVRDVRNHYRVGEEGDFIFEKGCKMGKYEEPEHLFVIDGNKSWTYYADTGIWLPGQDQLQEMVLDKNVDDPIGSSLYDFLYWIEHDSDGGFGHSEDGYAFYLGKSQFKTLEQFWLAFIMKEKYNKIWNGEEWVAN